MGEAVIFDCDGVLVDSEVIAHAVEIAVLAEIGLAYDTAEFKARFMGMSDKASHAALEQDGMTRLGRPIIAEIRPVMQARYDEAIGSVGEVRDAAAAIALLGARPKAVASSSGSASLERKLRRIEDSVNGVKAGLAAGMTVWGFAGGGHMDDAMAARLANAGAARVVRDRAEAAMLFAAL